MKRRENPYKLGSSCYIAYEAGYMDAIEDVNRMMEEESYGGGDHAEERAAGVPEHHEE